MAAKQMVFFPIGPREHRVRSRRRRWPADMAAQTVKEVPSKAAAVGGDGTTTGGRRRDMRTIALSGSRLRGARNIIALVLLAAVYALRSRISWWRWQRRRPALKEQSAHRGSARGAERRPIEEGSGG